jgi:hypothetical protein
LTPPLLLQDQEAARTSLSMSAGACITERSQRRIGIRGARGFSLPENLQRALQHLIAPCTDSGKGRTHDDVRL